MIKVQVITYYALAQVTNPAIALQHRLVIHALYWAISPLPMSIKCEALSTL